MNLKVRRKGQKLGTFFAALKILLYGTRVSSFTDLRDGMYSIAPKTASANVTNAKVLNRQMIGRPIVL